MKEIAIATLGMASVLALGTWLSAARSRDAVPIYLATSFDFNSYPACGVSRTENCITAIRFYDADSGKPLAEVKTSPDMKGRQSIVGKAAVRSVPRRVYAVTVYVDSDARVKQGLPGETTKLMHDASR